MSYSYRIPARRPQTPRLELCITRERPKRRSGLATEQREARPRFQPREVPAWPTLRSETPGAASPRARQEGRVGAGSGPRCAADPLRPPPRRRGGSRTYRVGLRRRPGGTAGRGGQAGGGKARGGGRRAEEEDARPLGRPQPLPSGLTPAAGRPGAGHSSSVRRCGARGRETRQAALEGAALAVGGRGPASQSVPARREQLPAPPPSARLRPPSPARLPRETAAAAGLVVSLLVSLPPGLVRADGVGSRGRRKGSGGVQQGALVGEGDVRLGGALGEGAGRGGPDKDSGCSLPLKLG
ncbi:hypothetical protein AB1E18_004894 [Capra hircus]